MKLQWNENTLKGSYNEMKIHSKENTMKWKYTQRKIQRNENTLKGNFYEMRIEWNENTLNQKCKDNCKRQYTTYIQYIYSNQKQQYKTLTTKGMYM